MAWFSPTLSDSGSIIRRCVYSLVLIHLISAKSVSVREMKKIYGSTNPLVWEPSSSPTFYWLRARRWEGISLRATVCRSACKKKLVWTEGPRWYGKVLSWVESMVSLVTYWRRFLSFRFVHFSITNMYFVLTVVLYLWGFPLSRARRFMECRVLASWHCALEG